MARKQDKKEPPVAAPDRMVLDEVGESPTVEVRVWRYGKLVHRELCESIEIAGDIVDTWNEVDGVECEVDDLSAHHGVEEILEPAIDGRTVSAARESLE